MINYVNISFIFFAPFQSDFLGPMETIGPPMGPHWGTIGAPMGPMAVTAAGLRLEGRRNYRWHVCLGV